MKNLEYQRKYELFTYAEIGKRPIDNPDNQHKFLQDFYFEYRANLEYLQASKSEVSIKAFDQVYVQMRQKLNSLDKKTPYGLPQKFHETLDNLYHAFIKEFCPVFYKKIQEIQNWEYGNARGYYKFDKFNEFFSSYVFDHWRRRTEDLQKYPKIVSIAYDIYLQKKAEYEEQQERRNAEKQRIHEQRMKSDSEYRAKQLFNSFDEIFGGFFTAYNSFFSTILAGMQKPNDSFTVLGLDSNANMEDVKAAYRKLSMQHHPDKGGNNERFIEITEARDKCLSYLQ